MVSSTVKPVVGPTPAEGPPGEASLADRERAEIDQVRAAELQAVLRELAVKEVYLKEAELELAKQEIREMNAREELADQLAEVRARAAELFGDLERAEAVIAELNEEIVELNDEIASIRATRSYRWSAAAASFVGRSFSPWRRGRSPAPSSEAS